MHILAALFACLGLGAPADQGQAVLSQENELLRLRLQALEDELQETGQAYSYVVVKGYISGAENVLEETMDIDQAKAWCNSNRRCKGFTIGGSEERPDDEVTVTFKVRYTLHTATRASPRRCC